MAPWNYVVICLCILLLALLIWKETTRFNKAHLIGRTIASIIAVAALACLAFAFNIKNQSVNKNTSAILLTDGYNKDSVAFYNKINASIYTLDNYFTAPNVDTLHVFGYGLSKAELMNIKSSALIFHPNKTISGINSADWQQHINAHQLFVVQGSFNNTFSTPVKLLLKAYNNSVDSVIINPNTNQHFNLKIMPQHVGKALFNLMALNNKDTVEQEPIPIEVLPTNKLNVLVLASSPDFENKFLSNWLAQNGFTIALRTTISKNKFKQSFLDTTKFSLNHITPEVLNKFDVLICDATELSTISLPELNAIKNQVSANGLGLIIRADSIVSSGFYHSLFPIKSSANNNDSGKNETLHVQIEDSSYNLNVNHPSFIQPQNGTQPLVMDRQNRLLVNSTLYGAGKIIFATLDNTYSWLLANNIQAYQNYWSLLLQQAAHKTMRATDFFVNTSFPIVNKPVEIVTASANQLSLFSVNETFVLPQQNMLLPYLSSGTFWPTFSGWQATIAADATINWWYAFDSTDWRPISNKQKLQDTYQYMNTNNNLPRMHELIMEHDTKPFAKVYFFLLLFLSCIYLWVERKLV